MKTIEQTRRELFEGRFPKHEMRKFTDADGDIVYADEWSQGAWIGFNAALDAVVIELPSPLTAPPYASYEGGWNDMRDEATDSIESTNLGLKIR